MPKVISFDEALARTDGKERSLLIGNGFSIEHFSYRTLLEKSGLIDTDPLLTLFAALDTYDFETAIRALESAAVVESAYTHDEQAKLFISDADRLREALVYAIRATHPGHRDDIIAKIPSCVAFLRNFKAVFSLNYDLLLYWVQLDITQDFQDGFGLGLEEQGFLGPFKEGAHCNIFNVHGGLQLFQTPVDDVQKRLMGASGVIDAISTTITVGKRLPIYVAEGSSAKKMAKVNSIPYLRHCYRKLSSSVGMFFVYGHSADPNDSHIYRAIFNSEAEHIYFCIHQPSADLSAIDGQLAHYKALYQSDISYTFVDSESAQVWNRFVEVENRQ